jgi:VWFA-related protein
LREATLAALLGLSVEARAMGAQAAPPPEADASIDFVVRDRKGLPVRDLEPRDVEILEAGTKRTPTSLRLVEPAPAGSPSAPRYLSLVFDSLDVEGQKNARKAALEFVAKAAAPDLRIAVFRVGLELWAVQGFTSDIALVRAAVERAASPEDQALDAVSTATRTLAARELGLPETASAAQAVIETLRVGDEMQKMRQDQSALYPLIAVAKGQAGLPGRKTVIYLSQGLAVPSRLDDVYRSLLSEANRSRVALYTLDARGLRTGGDLEATKSAMEDLSRAGLQEAKDNVNQQRGVGDFRAVERASEGVRQGETSALKELAQSTGAEYLGNSNDLRKATDRILSDASSYYEASYAPSSGTFDGLFRTTEVRVARPGVRVAGRSGYYALPPQTGGQTLLAYEIPMITALASTPPPRDFAVRASGLVFGRAKTGREVMLVAEVPLSGLNFAVDEVAKTYKLRFALLAQVKDDKGAVVYKVSQSYPLEGPLDKLDALKRGNVSFKRSVDLPPGRYSLETAVQDRETKATAVAQSTFDIGAHEALVLGSPSVIRRVEPVPPEKAGAHDPLRVDALRLVPNLDAPISKGAAQNLSLFLPVYTATADPVTLTLEMTRGGVVVARTPVELPAREADGRIPCVGTFPLAALEAGAYKLSVVARQGTVSIGQSLSFDITP